LKMFTASETASQQVNCIPIARVTVCAQPRPTRTPCSRHSPHIVNLSMMVYSTALTYPAVTYLAAALQNAPQI